ncbi:hypothetical protein ABIE67_007309 [Streptomyces sp. V4I8]|uniref:hypothetical protein n=1 Tax=Streptomyces sp. V4I8 TaxID=3156469 RepID=UPI003515C565
MPREYVFSSSSGTDVVTAGIEAVAAPMAVRDTSLPKIALFRAAACPMDAKAQAKMAQVGQSGR